MRIGAASLIALGAIAAVLGCGCGIVNTVTCTLGTPVVLGSSVSVPYILAEHGTHLAHADSGIDVKVTIELKTRSLIDGHVSVYPKSFFDEIEGSPTKSGTVVVSIKPDEEYMTGTARLVDLSADDGTSLFM
jgi:hypothetical protein